MTWRAATQTRTFWGRRRCGRFAEGSAAARLQLAAMGSEPASPRRWRRLSRAPLRSTSRRPRRRQERWRLWMTLNTLFENVAAPMLVRGLHGRRPCAKRGEADRKPPWARLGTSVVPWAEAGKIPALDSMATVALHDARQAQSEQHDPEVLGARVIPPSADHKAVAATKNLMIWVMCGLGSPGAIAWTEMARKTRRGG